MPYRIRALDLTFGTRRLTEGPGLSAFMRFMRLPPVIGSRMSRKTRTPMPPIQWVKLRHIRIQFGMTSTSDRILAPVVVKPDTVSNSASIGLEIAPENRNGSAPAILRTIQLRETVI